MRVIAGAAKGHNLQTIEGLATRPTTDRIKETLFNIIAFDLPECSFLDLFSGSGQMAIEALSRQEGKQRRAIFARDDILQTGIQSDTHECQREEERRERLCQRGFDQFALSVERKQVGLLQH